MSRCFVPEAVVQSQYQYSFGLDGNIIAGAIEFVYHILDKIDSELLASGGEPLAALVEYANLSAIVGNLFRNGVIRASEGRFKANSPHTFPDLLGVGPGASDIEIKVALERNKPKGHLAKPGPHMIVRYVLVASDGSYRHGKTNRGVVVRIWEVRVGVLEMSHFNISNTEGDSGKTAVVNAAGMAALFPVYLDPSVAGKERRVRAASAP